MVWLGSIRRDEPGFSQGLAHAKDLARTDELAGDGRRHIVLADVDAVGIHCERDIDPVIYDKKHARFPAQGAKLRRLLDHFPGAGGLFPILDDTDPAPDRGLDDLPMAASL